MRTRRKKICRRESADTKNSELVELLPSDVWIKILEMGIDNSILTHKDLCSLSISSKYFNKISVEDTLWSSLLALDFPIDDDDESSTSTPFRSSCMKSLYKYKVKLQLDSLRRTIDDIRGESVVITRQLRQLRTRLTKQKERLKAAQEFSDAQEIWYTGVLEELATTETRHKNVKKRISKMHSSFKKKSKNFSLSLEDY